LWALTAAFSDGLYSVRWKERPVEPTREQWYQQRIAELEAQVADLKAQLAQLAEQVAKLSKNSSNSSKPPSSDIVKPPKSPPLTRGKKRKIGGQPGHPKYERESFTVEELDDIHEYRLDRCPDCGGKLRPGRAEPRVVQQIEVLERPVEIVEHRSEACWCRRCRKTFHAPLPPAVEKGGLVGPGLTTWVAYLKGAGHASFSTIRKFFRDVLKVTISRGQLVKVINKVTAALAGMYEDLRARLPGELQVNVDETGHKENGKGLWTWCFRTQLYTLYKIDPSRGSDVLIETLGEAFDGVLGCDYFSAYRKYMKDFDVEVQFCLAHLIRDVKFLNTLPDQVTRDYGQRLLNGLRQLFRVIHRRDQMADRPFQRALERARKRVLKVGRRAPSRIEAQNMAERFRRHGDAYFRFITTPGIEPTNNLAEQAIRFVVIDRHITQGTRSERGRQWCERIWTAIATCAQQGRSVFDFLRQTITAYFHGQPTPSILPAGP
jgi:transposase